MKYLVFFAALASFSSFALPAAVHAGSTPLGVQTKAVHPTKPAASAHSKQAAGKTYVVTAAFVSYDQAAGTITFKDHNGQTSSAPAERTALKEAARLKQGVKVLVTCRDNAKGEHQAITAIRKATTRS